MYITLCPFGIPPLTGAISPSYRSYIISTAGEWSREAWRKNSPDCLMSTAVYKHVVRLPRRAHALTRALTVGDTSMGSSSIGRASSLYKLDGSARTSRFTLPNQNVTGLQFVGGDMLLLGRCRRPWRIVALQKSHKYFPLIRAIFFQGGNVCLFKVVSRK